MFGFFCILYLILSLRCIANSSFTWFICLIHYLKIILKRVTFFARRRGNSDKLKTDNRGSAGMEIEAMCSILSACLLLEQLKIWPICECFSKTS